MPAHDSARRCGRKAQRVLYSCLWFGLVLTAGAPCTTAWAQSNAVIAALDDTVQDWMHKHNVHAAAFAALKDGRLAGSRGYGGMDPAKPAHIGSLSKAITAVCVGRLIDTGRLAFTAPLGVAIPDAFRRYGEPADPRFKAITIEQLLMHRAGLARSVSGWRRDHDMATTFRRVLAQPLESNPGGEMDYSNIGYLTLGIVAETFTGQDYEEHCGGAALAPMQAAGYIDQRLRQRAPNGGWTISAIDYAKFVQVFDRSAGVLGEPSQKWQDKKWNDARIGERAYGLGTYLNRTPHGRIYSHGGSVGLRERGGAYTMKFDSGWTTVVTFDGDPRGLTGDLHRRLEAAVYRR